MQTKIITLFMALVAFAVQAQIQTPQPSPAAEIEQVIGLTEVEVDYSRPAMRGRTIFGDLVPYGRLWRTGANQRTSFSTSTDITVQGKELKEGTYALFTIPNADSWEVIFYTDAEGNGAPRELDESKVALRVMAKPENTGYDMENFTIAFADLADGSTGMMYLMWEKTRVGLKIGTPSDKMAMKSIKDVMAGEPSANDYFAAAGYYHKTGKDLNQALIWAGKAVEMNPEAFWMTRQKSLIQADLGDKKGAIETAKVSLAAAEKAGNMDYVKMNKESIAAWSK
jgi:hypothetical protein